MYIHELTDWPNFHWEQKLISELLASARYEQGKLIGKIETLNQDFQTQALHYTLIQDVLNTHAIDEQIFNSDQVCSSLARRLGIDTKETKLNNKHIEGIVDVVIDTFTDFDKPLTIERIFSWHRSFFPTGYSSIGKIKVGAWRDDSEGFLEVVSGQQGDETVHFIAPKANLLNDEINTFLDWFENCNSLDLILKAAISHLWFITLHPFDDGNGRVARAIADLSLARSEQSPNRYYSMASQIYNDQEHNLYYEMLDQAQTGTMDITPWIEWFLSCFSRAIAEAHTKLANILFMAKFWESVAALPMNDRQCLMVSHLLNGYKERLTSSKWAKLTNCSQDTALRDILNLVEYGILTKDLSGGRSTSYSFSQPRYRSRHNRISRLPISLNLNSSI